MSDGARYWPDFVLFFLTTINAASDKDCGLSACDSSVTADDSRQQNVMEQETSLAITTVNIPGITIVNMLFSKHFYGPLEGHPSAGIGEDKVE